MRINTTQIKRRIRLIRIRHRNKHRPINRRIALVRRNIRLDRHARIQPARRIDRDIHQWRVCDVELRDPDDPLRGSRFGVGDVTVVGADGLAWVFPLEVDGAAGV